MPRAKVSGSTVYLSKEQIDFIFESINIMQQDLELCALDGELAPKDKRIIEELRDKLGPL